MMTTSVLVSLASGDLQKPQCTLCEIVFITQGYKCMLTF